MLPSVQADSDTGLAGPVGLLGLLGLVDRVRRGNHSHGITLHRL